MKIQNQGRAIIEVERGEFTIMLPDGQIEVRFERKFAIRIVERWAKRHLHDKQNGLAICEIEWRYK